MKNFVSRYFIIAASLLAALVLAVPQPVAQAQTDDVSAQVEKLIEIHRLKNSKVGILAVNLQDGSAIFRKNDTDQLVPASNAKLLVTAAALHYLGTDFSFITTVYRTGAIGSDGALAGDLVVKGSGDPNISGRFFDGNVCAVFEKWADRLAALGIKTVAGDIVLDDTIFDREFVHPAWAGEELTNWYAAPVSALSFNDNCVDITVSPSAVVGAAAQILCCPRTGCVKVQNKTTTVEAKGTHEIAFYRKPGTNIIEVKGKVWKRAKPCVESVTVENPTMYFGSVLRETLERKGIKCKGSLKMADAPVDVAALGAQVVVSSKSALSATIAVANKRSQNFYAEQLLKYLGWSRKGAGTFENGCAVVTEFLESLGYDRKAFVVSDGSGLSRSNRVTPTVLVGMLRWGLEDEGRREVFQNSLAVAGVDGTLAKRMADPMRKGRVLGKSGYISGVSSLSGYVLTKDGEPAIAFSVLINHRNPAAMPKPFQDAFCLLLISRLDSGDFEKSSAPGGESER